MALDWRDIRDRKIEICKMKDADGNVLALAKAGRHHEGYPLWYGCSWQSYQQAGDLSCGSRYYEADEVTEVDDTKINYPMILRGLHGMTIRLFDQIEQYNGNNPEAVKSCRDEIERINEQVRLIEKLGVKT